MSGSCFNFKLVWANRCMGQWYVSALLSPSKGLCTQMDLFLLLNISVNNHFYNRKSSTVLSYRKCWWVSSDKILLSWLRHKAWISEMRYKDTPPVFANISKPKQYKISGMAPGLVFLHLRLRKILGIMGVSFPAFKHLVY